MNARDVPELGVDGAALEGTGAAGSLVEVQKAHAPEIQRVSTSAGSEVLGYFTLGFNGEETTALPYNATAEEVRYTKQLLPGGVVASNNEQEEACEIDQFRWCR